MKTRILGYINIPKNFWEGSRSLPPIFVQTKHDNMIVLENASPKNKEENG